jgi:hypothetical protein
MSPLLKNLLLMLCSTTACLLLLEVGLRIGNGLPVIPDRNFIVERSHIADVDHLPLAEYDPALGWVQRPNLRIASDRADGSFTTGEYGIRMNRPEIQPIPHNSILAVGDSFTAGSEVGDVQAWPAQLEREIGEAVVNAAVGGWGADQIVMRAEQLIPKLTPRTIIVSLLADDIVRDAYRVYGGLDKPYYEIKDGNLVQMNQPVVPRAIGPASTLGPFRRTLGYSYLADYTMSRLGIESWFAIAAQVQVPIDIVGVSCLLLERLKHEADDKGTRLILLMQWGGGGISQWQSRPYFTSDVLDCARQAGIQTVDTWDRLKQVNSEGEDKLKELYHTLQGGTVYAHMSSAGNKLMADLVAKAVRDPSFNATETAAPVAVAPRTGGHVLGARSTITNLHVSPNSAPAPEGAGTATLIEDDSDQYGVIFEDVQIDDDTLAHNFSLYLRAGSSPTAQIQLQYLGGARNLVYFAYVETATMMPSGPGIFHCAYLGNGWYRLSLMGANNASGNTIARVSVYPRQPTTTKPMARGSLYMADPRFDP